MLNFNWVRITKKVIKAKSSFTKDYLHIREYDESEVNTKHRKQPVCNVEFPLFEPEFSLFEVDNTKNEVDEKQQFSRSLLE